MINSQTLLEITEPLTFYIVSPEVVRYSLKFPDTGKILILHRGDAYTTEDKTEQEFLSQQKYLGVRRFNDKEFRMWATLQFDRIPTVYNALIKDKKDVEEFVWSSEFENEVIKNLKERGYIVYRAKKKGEE